MTTTLRTGRIEALSDGVFAIAITLLVLEISVTGETQTGLLAAFLQQWPSYLAYLVSSFSSELSWCGDGPHRRSPVVGQILLGGKLRTQDDHTPISPMVGSLRESDGSQASSGGGCS